VDQQINRYRRVLTQYQQTSRDAWESVWRLLPTIDGAIVRAIDRRHGGTSEEIEDATRFRHQTVSAQIRHMVEGGLLEDSGRRRLNRNGRRCIVWQLVSNPSAAANGSLF
jgi:hypothetical protein